MKYTVIERSSNVNPNSHDNQSKRPVLGITKYEEQISSMDNMCLVIYLVSIIRLKGLKGYAAVS